MILFAEAVENRTRLSWADRVRIRRHPDRTAQILYAARPALMNKCSALPERLEDFGTGFKKGFRIPAERV